MSIYRPCERGACLLLAFPLTRLRRKPDDHLLSSQLNLTFQRPLRENGTHGERAGKAASKRKPEAVPSTQEEANPNLAYLERMHRTDRRYRLLAFAVAVLGGCFCFWVTVGQFGVFAGKTTHIQAVFNWLIDIKSNVALPWTTTGLATTGYLVSEHRRKKMIRSWELTTAIFRRSYSRSQ